jgi:hypothetical protein
MYSSHSLIHSTRTSMRWWPWCCLSRGFNLISFKRSLSFPYPSKSSSLSRSKVGLALPLWATFKDSILHNWLCIVHSAKTH